jgi:hypothetical protein
LDDSDIWAISPGDELRCGRDLVMDDSGVIAFTAGRSYRVQSTHPIAQPPLLRVVDDQGESHGLSAADLAEYFVRPDGLGRPYAALSCRKSVTDRDGSMIKVYLRQPGNPREQDIGCNSPAELGG